jgi:predicted type IV restriction endonuclease
LLDDREFKEDSGREVIITPILTRLGYTPSGSDRVIRSKSLVHPFIYVGTRKHPVTIIPDYTLLSDGKVLCVLDAKSPTEDILSREHVQQAYSYAIHPEVKSTVVQTWSATTGMECRLTLEGVHFALANHAGITQKLKSYRKTPRPLLI